DCVEPGVAGSERPIHVGFAAHHVPVEEPDRLQDATVEQEPATPKRSAAGLIPLAAGFPVRLVVVGRHHGSLSRGISHGGQPTLWHPNIYGTDHKVGTFCGE